MDDGRMPDNPTGRREELSATARPVFVHVQHLRGIAAVLVVYFHTKIYDAGFAWHWDRSFGYGGVDIFFVISGFIMTITNFDSKGSPARFLVSRIKRIYPPYWIALSLSLILHSIVASYANQKPVDILYLTSSYTLLPFENSGNFSHGVPFLAIGWTLVFEMFFYAIFTVCLFCSGRHRRFLLQALAIIAAVLYGVWFQPSSATLGFYTDPITLEFLLGAAAALCAGSATFRLSRAALLGLLVGLFVPLFMIGGGHGGGFKRVIHFGLPAAGIVACITLYETCYGAVFQSRALKLMGDASYAIYLFHPFLLVALATAAQKMRLPVATPVIGAIAIPAVVLLCVVVGIGAHKWIELPVLRAVRRLGLPKDRKRSLSNPATHA